MRGGICFALLLLVSIAARAETNCVDPSSLAGSAVSITRYLDNQERDAKSDVIGIQGTGWFQSTNTIVTVEHVAVAMKLSKETWKQLTVQSNSGTLSISARIRQVIGDSKEKLAVLELQSPVPSARTATVRSLPLEPEERLLTIAYPRHEPRSVSGRFVRYATEVPLSGAALLELFDGDDRFAVDHGASGAPVFDCEGRVAAVISTVISQTLRSPFGVMRISTPWGTPNVLSIPVAALAGRFQIH
jgi:S1-C subfamily serine protease